MMIGLTNAFLANAARQSNHIMEMLDQKGGNFWTSPYRLILTIAFSALVIWLVVRILKSDSDS